MAAIVQAIKQLRARIRGSAKPVLRLAVLEVRIDIARVNHPALADKVEDRVGLYCVGLGPSLSRCTGMHHGVGRARQETIVDEEVFLDAERGIAALKITGAIVLHAMA